MDHIGSPLSDTHVRHLWKESFAACIDRNSDPDDIRGVLTILNDDDEYDTVSLEMLGAHLIDGTLPAAAEILAREWFAGLLSRVSEQAAYWASPRGADVARAQTPGFVPPVFSAAGHAQDTSEGFTRRRVLRARVTEIASLLGAGPERS